MGYVGPVKWAGRADGLVLAWPSLAQSSLMYSSCERSGLLPVGCGVCGFGLDGLEMLGWRCWVGDVGLEMLNVPH